MGHMKGTKIKLLSDHEFIGDIPGPIWTTIYKFWFQGFYFGYFPEYLGLDKIVT